MKLSFVERLLVNNPARGALQRRLELPLLLHLGGAPPGPELLEFGCGCGVGAEHLLEALPGARVQAFDLDPHQVHRARARLGERARIWVGCVTRIPAARESFDGVFGFGVLQRVPEWPRALSELTRVLRPGGRLYLQHASRGLPLPGRDDQRPRDLSDERLLRALSDEGLRVTRRVALPGLVALLTAEKPLDAAQARREPPPQGPGAWE